jgi:ATP-dependent Lon protease
MNDDSILDMNFILEGDQNVPDGDFFPVLSREDEMKIETEDIPEVLHILPLKNTVLFPGVIIPITVGRDKSIRLIKDVYKGDKTIGVVAQKDPDVEDPGADDIYDTGTVAYIIKLLQMPDGNNTVILQGRNRFQIDSIIQTEPYISAKVTGLKTEPTKHKDPRVFTAVIDSIKDIAVQIIRQSPNIPSEAGFALQNIESPGFLVHFVCSHLTISIEEKQALLQINDFDILANKVLEHLTRELQMTELKNQIQKKVKKDIDKQQRDYLLNMQLKTIQDELGGSPHEQEIIEMKEKASVKLWNDEIKRIFEKELQKLQRMNPSAAEYSIQMNYLEYLVELPWNEFTKDNNDLNRAGKVLDKDHFGLEKVKERILEFLAVLKMKNNKNAPILCLVGPPGVGKTSLGKSIAESLGRKYIRISLGGLRDEAELRGHRKTYIGAMPGRIIQSLKKAKSANPVFVLDEIDKVSGNNINGDPQAALLEILDPEQNTNFHDNYLEIDYDLSKILFIATANTLSTVHPALRDRMEIIEVNGYTLEEKVEISNRHLIPKQLDLHGLKPKQLVFSKKSLARIIEDHTRESGVRALEQSIAKIIRYYIRYVASDIEFDKNIKPEDVEKCLGLRKFQKDRSSRQKEVGVVTGLAWTMFGGEILYVEASISKGKGLLSMTGNLGDVMKESATLAYEYIKSHSKILGIDNQFLENHNIHVHVPEGATPKDGPSAGITIFTALSSVFTGKKVNPDIAMTGEITLRGRVLPVGGIKEKILAAKRAGLKEIILSEDNRKDVVDIHERYTKGLTFHYIKEMKEVCEYVFV